MFIFLIYALPHNCNPLLIYDNIIFLYNNTYLLLNIFEIILILSTGLIKLLKKYIRMNAYIKYNIIYIYITF